MSADLGDGNRLQPSVAQQKLLDLAIWLGLLVSIFAVYAQVGSFDFIVYDDLSQVYGNPHVQAGLTPASIKWALTSSVLGYWVPLTLLSHLAVTELFGMQSGAHHLVNVLFHALAAGLLYLALSRATGARAPSAFVAFVFALHPLHVESVAWVAERKDVLAAFFWFLALYWYVRYAERPSLGRYLLMALAFGLGLLSKPMLVTFPFTLILLDIWPLHRTQWPKTIVEKLPLVALSAAHSAVTYLVQGAVGAFSQISFLGRVENAFLSYAIYIRQTFWPVRLACFYPFRHTASVWPLAIAAVGVLVVTAVALLTVRSRPYVMVGWLWYVGTLIPVIGLVQVGMQAHADRYMYIPMVGLTLILAWGGAEVIQRWRWTKSAIVTCAVLGCLVLMAVAWRETAYWQDNQTLFERALEVTQGNFIAENNLGSYLLSVDRNAEAIGHFEAALRFEPGLVAAQRNLAMAVVRLEGCAPARPHLEEALRVDPSFSAGNRTLAQCDIESEDYAGAIPHFEVLIRETPDDPDLHYFLGLCFSKMGRISDAIQEYREAVHLAPEDIRARAGLRQLPGNISVK